jgi:hypothetical protein
MKTGVHFKRVIPRRAAEMRHTSQIGVQAFFVITSFRLDHLPDFWYLF